MQGRHPSQKAFGPTVNNDSNGPFHGRGPNLEFTFTYRSSLSEESCSVLCLSAILKIQRAFPHTVFIFINHAVPARCSGLLKSRLASRSSGVTLLAIPSVTVRRGSRVLSLPPCSSSHTVFVATGVCLHGCTGPVRNDTVFRHLHAESFGMGEESVPPQTDEALHDLPLPSHSCSLLTQLGCSHRRRMWSSLAKPEPLTWASASPTVISHSPRRVLVSPVPLSSGHHSPLTLDHSFMAMLCPTC